MSNPIVTVNVSQVVAPAPSTLQKQGAFISQGATNTSPGTKSLLTQYSDLATLLTGAKALTSISWSGGVATGTTTAPHGYAQSENVELTIVGASPAAYNGTFLCTITGASTFTYPLIGNPGGSSTAGVYTEEDVAELVAMATTFFAQGRQQAVTVLELGEGSVDDGVAFLTTWIGQNPNTFYSYLVPRIWDSVASYLAFLANFNATNAKTYFFTTTTLQNYGNYTSLMKCVVAMVEAPKYGVWAANALTGLVYGAGSGSGVVTATTTTNHGVLPGQYFKLSGNSPAGWNGWFLALQGTTGSNLEFNVPSSIGAESVLGTLVQSQYASAGVTATEFSLAAAFWVSLNYKPSSTNKVTPYNLAYLFGVTPFPTDGNASLLSTLNAADINIVRHGRAGRHLEHAADGRQQPRRAPVQLLVFGRLGADQRPACDYRGAHQRGEQPGQPDLLQPAGHQHAPAGLRLEDEPGHHERARPAAGQADAARRARLRRRARRRDLRRLHAGQRRTVHRLQRGEPERLSGRDLRRAVGRVRAASGVRRDHDQHRRFELRERLRS